MVIPSQSPLYDERGQLRWSKRDVDLQGRSVVDDFVALQRKLIEIQLKDDLTVQDLEDLILAAARTRIAADYLLQCIRYLRLNHKSAA